MTIDNSSGSTGKVPSYIPIGNEVMHRYAEKSDAVAINAFSEVLFDMSTTAHIIGGCAMGRHPDEGVVNDQFAVFNYPNMYIADGSIIPCNLGVNPALTITALSEYAMAGIPEKEGNQQRSLKELLASKVEQ